MIHDLKGHGVWWVWKWCESYAVTTVTRFQPMREFRLTCTALLAIIKIQNEGICSGRRRPMLPVPIQRLSTVTGKMCCIYPGSTEWPNTLPGLFMLVFPSIYQQCVVSNAFLKIVFEYLISSARNWKKNEKCFGLYQPAFVDSYSWQD